MRIWAIFVTLPLALMARDTNRGVKYLVECQNKECGYTAEVFFGGFSAVDFASMPDGGMFAGGSYGPATGFCVYCRQFVRGMVYLGTFPGWEKEDDRYLGDVWDSTTGKGRLLFRCPKCERPVMRISGAREITHCPRCRGAATCRRAGEKEETGDDKLRQELQQRYRGALRQADLNRQNDPNLYMQRLTAVEVDLQHRAQSHAGLRGGIGSMMDDGGDGGYGGRLPEPQGVLYQPEAVPFLLDMLINGPPSQAKGLAKAAHPEIEYWHSWKPGEYELWARCLAASIVGRYKHPDVVPILGEHLKRASQRELRYSSGAGLVASRDPNAIAPLIEALSDSDSTIRMGAWFSVNYMTERGMNSFTDPSVVFEN